MCHCLGSLVPLFYICLRSAVLASGRKIQKVAWDGNETTQLPGSVRRENRFLLALKLHNYVANVVPKSGALTLALALGTPSAGALNAALNSILEYSVVVSMLLLLLAWTRFRANAADLNSRKWSVTRCLVELGIAFFEAVLSPVYSTPVTLILRFSSPPLQITRVFVFTASFFEFLLTLLTESGVYSTCPPPWRRDLDCSGAKTAARKCCVGVGYNTLH